MLSHVLVGLFKNNNTFSRLEITMEMYLVCYV